MGGDKMERTNTRREVCDYFKVTRQTIYDWQKQGMPFERIGKKMLRYNILGGRPMKLYELTQSMEELKQLITEGELDNDMLVSTLESVELDIETKADNICCIIKELEGNINTLASEKERLTSLSERYNKNIDWLKNYLKFNLVKVGKEKLKTDRFSINVSDRKPKLVINEELLSNNYKYEEAKVITTYIVTGKQIGRAHV